MSSVVLVAAIACAFAPNAAAQTGYAEAFYVDASPTAGDFEAATACGREFGDPLNASGAFTRRASEEARAAISDCTEEAGGPQATEQCLVAMSTTTVDYIVLVDAVSYGGTWLFRTEVFDTREARYVWSDDETSDVDNAAFAAREACDELGVRFVASRGGTVPAPSVGTRPSPAPAQVGMLEVLGVSPSPVSVWVDGEEVGVSGGQILLPSGTHQVLLRAPGYRPYEMTVEIEADRVESLRGISLEPLPATLVVRSTVAGATVRIDGRDVGVTSVSGTTEFETAPGLLQVEVVRDGYEPWSSRVTLSPGGRSEVDAVLSVVPAAPSCGEGFVLIEAGTFTMGSPASEVRRLDDETQHQVTLTRDYCLGETEVTQGQWELLMENNPSHFGSCGDTCPVDQVNWYEALAYANALSAAEGLSPCYALGGCNTTAGDGMECASVSVTAAGGNPLLCEGYRLPTEAEWEYAVRGGTTTATYRGDLQSPFMCDPQPNLEPIAWYCENASVSYADAVDCSALGGPSSCGTRPVAARTANAWGLHDMLGNVWEWTWDGYGAYPGTARDPLGVESGSLRVLRGGSWLNSARFARAAYRLRSSPGTRINSVGFRLARSVP